MTPCPLSLLQLDRPCICLSTACDWCVDILVVILRHLPVCTTRALSIFMPFQAGRNAASEAPAAVPTEHAAAKPATVEAEVSATNVTTTPQAPSPSAHAETAEMAETAEVTPAAADATPAELDTADTLEDLEQKKKMIEASLIAQLKAESPSPAKKAAALSDRR